MVQNKVARFLWPTVYNTVYREAMQAYVGHVVLHGINSLSGKHAYLQRPYNKRQVLVAFRNDIYEILVYGL